ncbi:succinyl-CoA synthetase beta subunit [Rhodoligotrophos appendicifer]|uniref:ATP-grasp domain-containing protein n=1 Tax=Rhodoligotrophos appendicifer TaxID=987056 RepID=UPI00117F3426|nr:ATP-grasp domain-containing protein [Rhodoligotrophos appendicifer]
MKLIEFEAKQLLRHAGLPVPRGQLVGPGDPVEARGPVAVKAQLTRGGRGKEGLVRLTSAADAPSACEQLLEIMTELGVPPLVLVEEQAEIDQECYLGWRIDDVRQAPVLMFSAVGGVDIEAQGRLSEYAVDPLRPVHVQDLLPMLMDGGLSGRSLGAVARFAAQSYRVFCEHEADLLEINPLAILPSGNVLALDAKMSLDENAAPRHGERRGYLSAGLQTAELSPLERRAAAANVTFVELPGRVAIFSGGAGLGMALVDALADAGPGAANFVDAAGGSSADVFQAMGRIVFERARRPDVDAIIMFFTLSATSLKSAVSGLLEFLDREPPPKPMVAGLLAAGAAEREMTLAQAREAFQSRGIRCVTTIDEAVSEVSKILDSMTVA